MKRSKTTTKMALAAAAALGAAAWSNSANAATVVWDGGATGTGTAWLTATNWAGDVLPAATDTIEFQLAGTNGPIGINLNNNAPPLNTAFHHHTVGSILQSGGRDRTINNSSTGATGSGTLSIGGVGGVLIANTSASNSLTLANNGNGTTLMTVNLPNSGSIDVTNAPASVIISSSITGAGNVTKTGAGVFTLTSGGNTFGTGPGPALTISSGTFRTGANTTSAMTNAFQVDAATMDVGGSGTFGTFTAGGLNANNGSVFNFDLGSGQQDLISLGSGALAVSGTSTINIAGSGFTPGQYTLLNYGSSAGAFTLGTTPAGFNYNLLTNATATILEVIGSNANLTWSGAVDANWNTTTANWTGGTGVFANNDFVNFDDAGNNTNVNISVPTVAPQTVTFNNSTKDYTISGGSMVDHSGGPTQLTKNGTGTVTLNNTNTITGAVAINGGTLAISSGAALGNVSGITISNGATLATTNALTTDRTVTFSTGGGTIDTGVNNVTVSAGVAGTGLATKTGTGTLTLSAPATKSGGWAINGGTVKVNAVDATGVSGVGTGTITTGAGSTFHIDNVRVGFQADGTTPGTGINVTTLAGGTLRATGANAGVSGNIRFQNNAASPVTIDVANAGDHLVTGNSIRNVTNVGNNIASSTELNVTGNGYLQVASGGTSLISDQFSGTWTINMGATGITSFGPILNGGFGEVLNGPGYVTPGTGSGGYSGETRPITVNSGTLAFGADQPNLRGTGAPSVISYRSPLTLNGGSIASTGKTYSPSPGDPVGANVTANVHANVTVAGPSSVLLYDPVLGTAGGSRNFNFMTDVNAINNGDGSPVSNNFTWNGAGNLSTVGVGPGDIGRLRFARNDGVISVDPAGSQLTIGANTVVELAGTVDALSDGTYHVDVNNNGALEVTAGVKNVGNVGGTSGTVTVNNGATLNANHVRGASLSVADATVLVRDSGSQPAGVSKVDDYTITGTGKIDLRDNKLITNKAIGTFDGTAYSGVQGDIQRAYNFGAWDQPGLMTSQPNAGQNAGPLSGTTTIGVATGEQVLFLGPTDTGVVFGQTVTGASTIAMYTYAGDVNFDGLVDGADYGTLDNWIQFPGTDGYANGDVNYDGVIDGADYGVLDNTIQLQGDPFPGVFSASGSSASAGLSGVTAVPEPTASGFAILGAAALIGRRRRRAT